MVNKLELVARWCETKEIQYHSERNENEAKPEQGTKAIALGLHKSETDYVYWLSLLQSNFKNH